MRTVLRGALGTTLCMVLAGCASSGASGASNGSAVAQRRTDRNVISSDEIAASHETNLYDLVRALRVEWFTSRGAAASNPGAISTSSAGGGRSRTSSAATSGMVSTPLQVYSNRQKVGTIDELKNISPAGIASIRYYPPTEAQAMFGTDNSSGAIQVIPVSGGKPE